MELAIIEAFGLGWMAVGYILGVAVHEAGHAVAVWAVGFQLRQVCVGRGRTVLRFRLSETWFVLRAAPIVGYVQFVPPPPNRRVARALVTGGGPLANGLMLLVAWAVYRTQPAWFGIEHPLALMGVIAVSVAQICILFAVLVPKLAKISGVRVPTDGLKLWRLLTRPEEGTLPQLHATIMQVLLPPGVPVPPQSGFTGEIVYQIIRLDRRRDAWAARDAAGAMQGLLQRDGLSVLERVAVLHSLVADELLFGNTGVTLASMDAWSREALALAPALTQRVFRGAVLVALGRFGEAQRCLYDAVSEAKGHAVPPVILVLLRAFLAQAAAGQGEGAAAAQWMEHARAAVPKGQELTLSPILARLKAKVPVAQPLDAPKLLPEEVAAG